MYRDMFLGAGVHLLLMDIFDANHASPQLCRQLAWVFSNFCRGRVRSSDQSMHALQAFVGHLLLWRGFRVKSRIAGKCCLSMCLKTKCVTPCGASAFFMGVHVAIVHERMPRWHAPILYAVCFQFYALQPTRKRVLTREFFYLSFFFLVPCPPTSSSQNPLGDGCLQNRCSAS